MPSTTESQVVCDNGICKLSTEKVNGLISKSVSKNCNDTISSRAKRVLDNPDATVGYNATVNADMYDPETNPQGYVNLGLAENKLCQDLMTEKLRTLPDDIENVQLRYYPDMAGMPDFKESLCKFIKREFKSVHDIKTSDIIVSTGVTQWFNKLAFAIAEKGDYWMTTSPYYYRAKNDTDELAGLNMLEVPIKPEIGKDGESIYTLDTNVLEEALVKAKNEDKNVKGFLLMNPHNPLGSVLSTAQLKAVLDFCHKHSLHVIVDEIYGMSVFDKDVKFTSVLSLEHPDPQRTHFLWGFSKDFGLSGYRCGVMWTLNKDIMSYLIAIGHFTIACPLVQMRLKNIIDDQDWFTQTYHPTLQNRLRENYTLARDVLTECGATVTPAYGSIFIWVNFDKFMKDKTFEEEQKIFDKFMAEKVFILPGQLSYSQTPGYFRLVYSLKKETLEEGLKRIKIALEKTKGSESAQ